MASQYIPPPAPDAETPAPSFAPPPPSTSFDRFDTSDAALAADVVEEPKDKLFRKLKEQPLVPIGSLLTCAALIAASHQLRKGNRTEFNRALRWRVGFQGLTVVAAVAGSLYYAQPALQSRGSSSSVSGGGGADDSLSGITTSPGRPATVLQLERAQERQQEERSALRRRLREAEDRYNDEQARLREQAAAADRGAAESARDAEERAQVERYIIGSGKGRPLLGQDARR
ncbi:Respiratory supercomplex factor 1, mitochondrial [Tilletia horrida]|uniref:Respiratory supercomplex factor 1, mitochondrial n=1 Tax=Tilletia horrida TaxID=155126 RepID=A0AAN6G8H3_9BASI|nr:Respiratory supercomplex factor 1, mitochondrial [Tilletia horrida]KAK0522433.1 Respiratory supercomplex factor 1, mitochondrial [Tilletia horrida]KAK0528794.1 Respiratory supercomplex factor 1, mitochondrial [Tilletia horrida]KAK0562362.1 Respiratory supercomplex factor 1, mitochondrial [Tilletia horrida]